MDPIVAWTIAFAVLIGRLAAEKEPVVALGARSVRVDLSAGPSFRELLRRFIPTTTDAASVRTVVVQASDLELQIGDGAATLRCRSELHDRARMAELGAQLELLLGAMIADPDRPVDQCSLLTARARQLLPDPTAAIPRPEQESVERTVAAIAAQSPSAPAIAWRGEVWTFGDLEARASKVAAALRERGVERGDRVVVTGQRCPAIVAAFLGVWKTGGVIVPVADDLPAERRRVIAREAGAGLAIVAGDEEWPVPVMRIAPATADVGGALQLREAVAPPASADAAYVFFTSGTTGTPKGVLGTHAGLAHFLAWQRETFGVSKSDRAAQLTGLSFDVVLRDMLMPLSAGATLCFPDREAASLDPELLLVWLRDEHISVMHSVPSVMDVWHRSWVENDPVPGVRLLFMAGEPLSQALVLQSRGRFPGCRVVNLYGPTETTLAKCFFEVPREPAAGTQPVGRAMRNAQAFVMSEAGILCGVGEPGEIVIRTPFRTRGYLGEQAAAAGRFRPNPLRDDREDLVYFTGDRGRLRLDGQLEILGRVDDQVKINGVRVEPGEVSAALRAHPRVASCFVAAHADEAGKKRLCAYVVPTAAARVEADDLRGHLSERLPAAMVPSAFVFLERMPLTANGKVDRKALPAPDLTAAAATEYVAPRDAVEETVAEVFRDVLRLERVGVHDDFFALGGHSLLAMQVVGRLRSALHIELPVRALFEGATVARLAERLRASPVESTATRIGRVDRSKPLLASFAQERLWFLAELAPGEATYNAPIVRWLRGALDVGALGRSLCEIVRRHEPLRTTLKAAGGRPRQIINAPSFPALVVEQVDDEPAARARMQAEVERPFELAEGPLFRATLLRAGPREEYLLVLVLHHVATDGWSNDVIERELGVLYEAFRTNQPSPLPDILVQYADFAAWQRAWLDGPVLDRQIAYWKRQLNGAPASLDLITDRPRPAVKQARGGAVAFALPRVIGVGIAALAREEGATAFMVLLAAFDVLLARHSGQDDIVVGTPIANRTHTALENLVGFFVNTLALRTKLDGNPTFRDVVRRTMTSALDAFEHQDIPFERVVAELRPARDSSRTPLFQVMFVHMSTRGAGLTLSGIDVAAEPAEVGIAKFDLTLTVEELGHGGELRGSLEYDAALFDHATAESLAERYRAVLEAGVVQPDTLVAAMPTMSEAERERVVVTWNATDARYPFDTCVHELFERQVDETPDATAVAFGTDALTYRALDERANRLARRLRAAGVGPEVLVAILLERSIEMLVAVLAVLKAGGAYVPLDTLYPVDRLTFMLEDSSARLLLTRSGMIHLPHPNVIDVMDPSLHALAPSRIATTSTSANAAYVIYTSGSTGRPKGVLITHRGLTAYLAHAHATYGSPGCGGAALHSSFAFDLTVTSMFVPLLSGGRVVMVPTGSGVEALAQVLTSEPDLTLVKIAPAHLEALALTLDDQAKSVERVFVIGGEVLRGESLRPWRASSPGTRLFNEYGPTETVVGCAVYDVPPGLPPPGDVSIGRPIANTRLYVLDAAMYPVPAGVQGELFIGGEQVSRGYWRRPALTAERFVPDPFSSEPGRRLYRTGDIAHWRRDGLLEYDGRVDHQVKLRGYRIELGEIESAVRSLSQIREAVVMAREDGPGDRRLVAYVVPAGPAALAIDVLKEDLRRSLPDYMVPSAFVIVDALPLTSNGKVDRKALPAPNIVSSAEYVAPRTATERELAKIWSDLLRVERVGMHDDFFALGGHSLLAMQVVSRIRVALQTELPVRALFEGATVARLAERIRTASASRAALTPIVAVDRTKPLVASSAQQRLWFLEQLDPGTPTYHVPLVLHIRGPLDVDCLGRCLTEIVRRHEVLRTTLSTVDGHLHQVVHPPADVRLDVHAATGDDDARRCLREAVVTPFDLSMGSPLRAVLIRLAHHDHRLAVVMHHVVTDGWSIEIFERELAVLYAAFHLGQPSALPELPIQYADYAAWQRAWLTGAGPDEQLAYWKEQLRDAPSSLEVPSDRPRPATKQHHGGAVRFVLPPGAATRVATLARADGCTTFLVLLAVFDVLLSRHTGQDDIVVGTPIANRTRTELEGMVGFFVNTLALRTRLNGDPSFRDVLQRVKRAALDAYDHQDIPFERLVEELKPPRDRSRTPVFQVMFAHHSELDQPVVLPGLEVERETTDLQIAKFDLVLFFEERGADLRGSLEYDAQVFDRSTVEALVERYRVLLDGVLAEPDQRISALPLLPDYESNRLRLECNTSGRLEDDLGIHELFERQVRLHPHAIAVEDERSRLSYVQLADRAARIAGWLGARGVRDEARVAVSLARSVDMVAALLGILMAGGVYVPIDPNYPAERQDYMRHDSGCIMEVNDASLAEAIASTPGNVVARRAHRHQLAYILYTSGSTGLPKGVLIEHRGVVRLVQGATWASFAQDDVFLAYAPLTFDASTLEIWGPLLNGARLVVAPAGLLGLDALGTLIRERGITFLFLTSGLFHQLVDHAIDALSGLRLLCSGGDVLSSAHVRRVLRDLPHVVFVNLYGPTENTVLTTEHVVRDLPEGQAVPIGRAVTNSTVYILDPYGRLAPIGVPGELYTGGMGVARGYVHAAATAEKFVPDPFSTAPGARLYRTGDIARWRQDGTLEFLGRRDGQVKLRGFRIELGEVALALGAAGAGDAVVIAREDVPGDKRLVAYLVEPQGEPLDVDAIRGRLRLSLPDHMVPSAFVVLPTLPLTTSGKVDRRALPAPDMTSTAEYIAPRTPTETIIASIWRELLRVARVGAHDDFFALGGHSLLATRVAVRLQAILGTDVPVRTLFELPTLSALAEHLRASPTGPTATPIGRVDRSKPLLASFAQARLWFLDQLEGGSATYNVPTVLRLDGSVDPDVLERALSALVDRHETLRTTFVAIDGEPHQVIHGSFVMRLSRADAASEEEARQAVAREVQAPFNLAEGPLQRATLVRLRDDSHLLVMCIHHIATDGWSSEILLRELSVLYGAFAKGNASPLPAPAIDYADVASWQRAWLRGAVLAQQLAFWKDHLDGAPAALELPTDRARPAIKRHHGATVDVVLPKAIADGVRELCRREGTTPFMVLLAAYQAVLSRWSGQRDIVVGTAIANRTTQETESIVGFFVNTLAMRTRFEADTSFGAVVRRVKQVALAAYAHQDVPFERLVEELKVARDMSRTPVFQAFFVMQNTAAAHLELAGLTVTEENSGLQVAKFDVALALHQTADTFHGSLDYDTALFDRATMERFVEHLGVFLASALAAPDAPVATLPMLSAAERRRVVVACNATKRPFDATPVHEAFERHAARTPEALAVAHDRSQLTYGELNRRANRLARALGRRGVAREDRVATLFHRSEDMLVAQLAVLKAGAAYSPLDPAHPPARLAYVAGDVGAKLLLSTRALAAGLDVAVPVLTLDDPTTLEELRREDDEDLSLPCTPRQAAYIIYTSGTTGRPKGSLIEHGNLANLVAQHRRLLAIVPSDRVSASTSPSFDVTITELWPTLATGAALDIVDDALKRSPVDLVRWLRDRKVTVVHAATPLAELMLDEDWSGTSVRVLCFGGQALRRRPRGHEPFRFANIYGPTECTVYVTSEDVEPGTHAVTTIGRPTQNTAIYILDGHAQPSPVGVFGEICIGGASVGRGYIGRPQLTAERFVANPFGDERGARLYRTGDRGRWLADGRIEYAGRNDDQVKIRGYRIELGEVESVLRATDGLREAVVLAREDVPGDTRLVAYVVALENAKLDVDALRTSLRRTLPEYMIPGAFVRLESLPLDASGKVDRKALPAPDFTSEAAEYVAPRTPTEEALARIWQRLLGVERVSVHDDFFALGGHSLLVVKLVAAVREDLGVAIPIGLLFERPTLERLAASLAAGGGELSTLLRLRDGHARVAVAFVGPIGGKLVGYLELVRALDEGPVLGLRAMGLAPDEAPLTTVEAIAAHHIAMLERAHSGPYVLVGWSFGGLVAFEMA